MNEETRQMALTIADWMREYPIEWIEYAYNSTIGEWKKSPTNYCEVVAKLKQELKEDT